MPNITTTPIEVEAEVKQYTLVGDDIYVKRYDNDNIPDWYKNLINNILNNNSTITNITDAYNYLNSLQEGYNLAITHLQDGQLVIDTRLESLKSSNDVALAGIADLWITKVDEASAQAIADTTIGAFFTGGNATSGAWFNERISTYASAIQANASNITVLAAVLGANTAEIERIDSVVVTLEGSLASATQLLTAQFEGLEVQLESVDQAYAGMFHQWDGVEDVAIGMFKLIGDIQYQYLGGTLGENSDGWVRTDASASADADQALTWAAGASKLITAPDGTVTGWSFGDGSGVQSEFKINADNFIIQGATGAVEYDNTLIVLPKTYEQTDPPSSGMLIGDTWIDIDDSYKAYTYTSTGWKANPASKVFRQATQPAVGISTNDIWYDTDDNNKPYYFDGSSWITIRDGTIAIAQATANSKILASEAAAAVNNNATTISGSKITTGTISAVAINANSNTGLPSAPISGYAWLSAVVGNTTSYDCGVSGRGVNAGVAGEATSSGGACILGQGSTYGAVGVSGISSSNIGVSGTSGSYHGVAGVSRSGYGLFTPNSTYSTGGYLPFTGSHIVYGVGEYVVGDIVEVMNSWVINVSQSYTQVTTTSTPLSKRVLGVVNNSSTDVLYNIRNNALFTLEDGTINPIYQPFIDELVLNKYKNITINAVGDGAINVCSENGNIEAGDYICSSNIPGKGMKQTLSNGDEDTIMRSYTVAKSLENVSWEAETIGHNGCFELNGIKCKMIACTYHCG